MIGVTAAASAGVYFAPRRHRSFRRRPRRHRRPHRRHRRLAPPPRLHSHFIRILFILVLLWISAQMLWKGVSGHERFNPKSKSKIQNPLDLLHLHPPSHRRHPFPGIVVLGTLLTLLHHPDYRTSHDALNRITQPAPPSPTPSAPFFRTCSIRAATIRERSLLPVAGQSLVVLASSS